MVFDIEIIKENIKKQEFSKKVCCFIIFGSSIRTTGTPKDSDIAIVLNDLDVDVNEISSFIFDNFINPDFTIYLKDEIESKLPFVDVGNGFFALNYLARGICIYGKNIFKEKLEKIDVVKYKESLLTKAFEYILRLRIVYFSQKYDESYKFDYFQKYVTRLIRMILLYREYLNYDNIDNFTRVELLEYAKLKSIFIENYNFGSISLNDYLKMFKEADKYIIKMFG
ncbi:MAG: hypothetical protein NTV72_01025 [Candidatus Taylorbacteria bacterium]|nr:hypothetical protein [Candidatus Taylorbacteria bacterium]